MTRPSLQPLQVAEEDSKEACGPAPRRAPIMQHRPRLAPGWTPLLPSSPAPVAVSAPPLVPDSNRAGLCAWGRGPPPPGTGGAASVSAAWAEGGLGITITGQESGAGPAAAAVEEEIVAASAAANQLVRRGPVQPLLTLSVLSWARAQRPEPYGHRTVWPTHRATTRCCSRPSSLGATRGR